MNRLEAAVLDVADHLEGSQIPYMIFGGFANLHWGRPRLTEDIDIKVDVPEPSWPSFVDGLSLEEIATALSIPLGTVKSRLHNALNTLRADPRIQKFFEP